MNFREKFVQTAFFTCGIINLLPTVGVLGPSQLHSLYDLQVADANFELLMRHRACLFCLIGGIMTTAAFYKPWRSLGYVVGLGSMDSYIVLACTLDKGLQSLNSKIVRVFWIDVVASLLLSTAAITSSYNYPAENSKKNC